MVSLLSKFKNLKELSLHGNRIKSIPPLSSLQKLAILDVSNNPIKVTDG
jgi:Leucine-rich repeat (LRR) protein